MNLPQAQAQRGDGGVVSQSSDDPFEAFASQR
jgi:hypothetical protein